MTTFTNVKGENKEIARQYIVDAIRNTKRKSGEVLSLPASDAIIERKLYKHNKSLTYTLCERDKHEFEKLMNNCRNTFLHNSKFYCGDIGNVILSAERNQYLHIILDYCGTVSTFEYEIQRIFEKGLIQVGGTLSITLSKRGCNENFVEDIERRHRLSSNLPFFERVERATIYFLEVCAILFDFERVEYFPYKDSRLEMMLFVYRRKK